MSFNDELAVARSRGKPSMSEEKLLAMVQDAQARFDSLPPEEQYWHKLAQRISMACSIAPEGTPRETVARDFLTRQVTAKYADWMLEKPEFRKVLNL